MLKNVFIWSAIFFLLSQPGISFARGFTVPIIIDGSGEVGFKPSVAIDQYNKPHISYYDLTDKTIKYATNSSGSWRTYTIDDIVGINTSSQYGINSQINTVIRVDSENKVHITYFREFTLYGDKYYNLYYATNRTGSWIREKVSSKNNYYWDASVGMDIDSNDNVYAVFNDSGDEVVLAKRNSSGWEKTYSVATGRYYEGPFVLDLDQNDYAHIIYCYEYVLDDETWYKTNSSGTWKRVRISYAISDWGASLSIDSSGRGNFAICHESDSDCDIYYGIGYSNASYSKYRIADAPGYYSPPWYANHYPTIAVDSTNTAHVFFDRSSSSYSLHRGVSPYYIQYMFGYDDDWSDTYYIVDSSQNALRGRFLSVVVDSRDGLHIAYYDYENDDLKYMYSPSDNPPPIKVPTITTTSISSITTNSAVSGGNVTSDGGDPITGKGVCWSTSKNPVIGGHETQNGTGIGNFTSRITGLNPGTSYHVRAYATNGGGTGYGDDVTFTTCPNCSGANITLTGISFPPNTKCECTATVSMVIGEGVNIPKDAEVTFKSPKIEVRPGFRPELGATVYMRQP